MKSSLLPKGLYYQPYFITKAQRQEVISYLQTLHPIWEMRYGPNHPPPEGDYQRQLKRPVYWLGNWQFACLDYYHPPEGIHHRAIRAEPYPKVLRELVDRIEFITKKNFHPKDVPHGWKLNTCLINFYGSSFIEDKWIDAAKVGEHKDFEPGPVASLSLGERAFFQFVQGKSTLGKENEVFSMWLEDSSLQIFGGDRWKKQLFHRVQRVEKKQTLLPIEIENFQTRRINFTFRYVPEEHIYHWKDLPVPKKLDTADYVENLARHSVYFAELMKNIKE